MEIARRIVWVIFLFSIAIGGLRCDGESTVGIAHSDQSKATSLTLSELPQENKTGEGRNRTNYTEVVVSNKNKYNGGRGGGGGYGWGWGGGGGGGGGGGRGGGGGWGWGGGGGGGGWWGWGCRRPQRKNNGGRGRGSHHNHANKKRVFNSEEYKLGEFAECMARGRCRGMRDGNSRTQIFVIKMDTIRKQATKLREQVAKQQQAVFKQFAGGLGGSDNIVTDEVELQNHQKLEKLYISTRTGKRFQRDIVRGVEGYIVNGSKQVEIGTKLSEDSRKYGAENTCTSGSKLSKAALSYSRARAQMEKERGNLLKALGTQVAEPLRAMVMGAPLEDARHLAQRYDRVRQEAEAQAIEVSRRQAKVRESTGNPDNISKLEAAEAKLQELKSNMATLGKEAAAAMAAVEGQQQRLTLQRLIAMVMHCPASFDVGLTQFFQYKYLRNQILGNFHFQSMVLHLRLRQSTIIIREFYRYLISLRARCCQSVNIWKLLPAQP
ncbi:hypothetical protein F0562_027168 [Nyssa sinensis]|uniref:Uncharacterized protein n=1 Tax=Nyssa sinensis TaxID=561372 RepID=A0A5J5B4K9_9ASTE|nr:hypothetical protein F0562_027168 [Nyssa sinensis]